MAAERGNSITEEEAEDLLFFGRSGELEELKGAIQSLIERRGEGVIGQESVSTLFAQVQQCSPSRNSPLHYAAANGHEGKR